MHALYAHVVSSGLRPEGLQAWYSVTVHAAGGRDRGADGESGEDSAEASLEDFEQGEVFFNVPVSHTHIHQNGSACLSLSRSLALLSLSLPLSYAHIKDTESWHSPLTAK